LISPAPHSALSRAGQWIDPVALMAIRGLELRARVVAEGFRRGIHPSPFHGYSAEFTEYRQYSPGEDTRYLDWRALARTDRLYLKRFEDETNLRCHLMVDLSRSMACGSLAHTKADYARTLAATLAWFVNAQGDAPGLLTFSDRVLEYLPARRARGHVRRLMLALEKEPDGAATSLAAPLDRIAALARKRGLIILISDLLAPVDSLGRNLARLSAAGHEAIVFQVLDPAEVSFDFEFPSLFEDAESGRELYVDPAAVRADYLRRLDAHAQTIREACGKLGFSFRRLVTNEPLESALAHFLMSRGRRSKAVRRRVQTAPA